ncbi:MAG: BamA/TamA family outer membrane protein, partial [Planctomycetota bacterium]
MMRILCLSTALVLAITARSFAQTPNAAYPYQSPTGPPLPVDQLGAGVTPPTYTPPSYTAPSLNGPTTNSALGTGPAASTVISPPPPSASFDPIAPDVPFLGNTGLPDPYAAPAPVPVIGPRVRTADLVINGFPAKTGRIMLGGAVNSDAGLTGQLTIDERNFDITRWPRSFRDLFSGTAFRGAGQTFRIEAAPGTQFKRYTVSFADPNLLGYLPVSLSVSGFLFDRRYDDWNEERLGGRVGLGYRITPDLSVAVSLSGQNVNVETFQAAPQALTDVLGDNELYGGEVSLTHDTRNSPLLPSEGHFFSFSYEEVFGDFDYGRFETEFRQYWQLAQRADGSGKQTLSFSTRLGISGDETPIFENFFAGGYATLRGFDFRGAGPVDP